jgi:arabinose-5-phosphate isomerase
MRKINFQKEAKKAFSVEIEELLAFSKSKSFDVNKFCQIIFECKGKVFLTGVGKSGHIANKISATLSSTGTPSFFIHPAEALHGDLGMIEKSDLVVALSKSGESKEIIDLLPALKQNKIKILSITENSSSTIAASSIEHLEVKVNKEACPNGLAPTSSTTVMLALGDAIAVSLLKARGFTASDFAKSHPGGKLGKRLTLQVADLMIDIKKSALVSETSSLRDVIIEISKRKQGFALIKNKTNKIVGIFSDGDLRRQLQKSEDIDKIAVGMVMTKKYKTVDKNNLALNAAEIMSKHKIYSLIVKESNKIVGFITMHEILEANVI